MKVGVDYIGACVACYCNDGKGNFVMQKRSQKCRDEKGSWEFGGGQLEFGEEISEGALREVREEYGVDGEVQEQLPSLSLLRENDGVKTHWVATPFFVKVDPKKVVITDHESTDEIGIFRLDKLPEPLHTGVARQLVLYKSYFDKYR